MRRLNGFSKMVDKQRFFNKDFLTIACIQTIYPYAHHITALNLQSVHEHSSHKLANQHL